MKPAIRAASAAWIAFLAVFASASPVLAERLTVGLRAPLVSVTVTGQDTVIETPQSSYATLRLVGRRLSLSEISRVPYAGSPGDIIPHGTVAADGSFRAAWLGGATGRYAHGILGDRLEASRLYVAPRNAETSPVFLELGPDSVFEDLGPRFVDIDGDGQPEILVVKS